MNKFILIYLRGCPNHQAVKDALLERQLDFKEYCQDDLPAENDLLKYSSPTILYKSKVVIGSKTEGSTACSISVNKEGTIAAIDALLRSEG